MQTTEPTTERVTQAVNAILETLGTPDNELHSKALAAFQKGDYQVVKRLAANQPI